MGKSGNNYLQSRAYISEVDFEFLLESTLT